ncbi:MAG: VCBS repeat-containing protein, partial [Streptomyces sp.]|nr:VCBS repeat-containing protein [Streptomyces sp.]
PGWLTRGGAGAGGFAAPRPFAAGAEGATADNVRFADINGDKKADYLVLEDTGAVRAWINNGGDGTDRWVDRGVYASGVAGATADNVRFADINGDGRTDYLVVAVDGSVHAYLNNGGDGQGGWTDRGTFASGVPGATVSSVHFADINGDTKADYLVVAEDGSVRAWVNNGGDGQGGFTERPFASGPAGATIGNVRFADADGDGKADYLVLGANGQTTVWINRGGDGAGGFEAPRPFAAGPEGATADNVRFADVTGDGKADYLVVGDDGSVRAWLNNGGDGQGGWTVYGIFASGVAGATADNVRFADTDNDGRADYLVVADNGSVRAHLNHGGDAGGWIDRGTLAAGTAPAGQVHI